MYPAYRKLKHFYLKQKSELRIRILYMKIECKYYLFKIVAVVLFLLSNNFY